MLAEDQQLPVNCKMKGTKMDTTGSIPPKLSESQKPPNQPKKEEFEWYNKWWIWLIAILVVIWQLSDSGKKESSKRTNNSSISDSSENGSERKLSAHELITEHAKMIHGSDARIRVDGGFYGGTYQVEVMAPVKSGMYAGGFDHYIYTAAADEKAQRVTIWELTSHN